MDQQTGKWIIIAGVALVIAGLVILLFHDKLHWIGRLPGDIRVEREHFRFYFPITTMILFSLVLTLLSYLFKRFF
jgi:hypothetical protein